MRRVRLRLGRWAYGMILLSFFFLQYCKADAKSNCSRSSPSSETVIKSVTLSELNLFWTDVSRLFWRINPCSHSAVCIGAVRVRDASVIKFGNSSLWYLSSSTEVPFCPRDIQLWLQVAWSLPSYWQFCLDQLQMQICEQNLHAKTTNKEPRQYENGNKHYCCYFIVCCWFLQSSKKKVTLNCM